MPVLAARAITMLAATIAAYFLAGRAGRRGGRLVAWINRNILNPIVVRIAGPLAISVVQHIGRRSGRPYQTPVFAEQTSEGFIVGLIYGADTDWCRNVLAARGAVLVYHGHELRLVNPRVIDAAAARAVLPLGIWLIHRMLGTSGFLTLRHPQDKTEAATPHRVAPTNRTHGPRRGRLRVLRPKTRRKAHVPESGGSSNSSQPSADSSSSA
jgi:deazaflavin-dependent oxidoreductase (nitroreductase family)